MKLCITGGGTGGHLAVAKALAEAANKKGIECIYIGSTSGQDKKYFEHSPLFSRKFFLNTTGVVNKRGVEKIQALFLILKAFFSSIRILKREKVDVVFSVGGFSAAPASFAAVLLRIPLFIHEQNAKTGRLNALLKKYAAGFFSSYDESSSIKAYPVAERFFEKARKREDIRTLIFLGGSQGARAINDLALETAYDLTKRGIKIIHQAGERDFDRVKEAYGKMGLDVELYGFIDNLDDLMQKADLAVSRAGASTLWELTANALPALYIPYPYAAGDHQYFNAKYLADNNLAWLKRENEKPKELLLHILDENISDKSESLMQLSQKGAADDILRVITETVEK